MTKLSLFTILALFAAPTLAAAAECAIDFDRQVQRSLDRRCAACHNDASPGGGLSLSRGAAYDNLVNAPANGHPDMPLITGGSLEQSYFYHKISGTHGDVGGQGVQMPVGGTLPDTERALFAAWIETCVPSPGAAEGTAP